MPSVTNDQYSTVFVLSIAAATIAHVTGVGALMVLAIAVAAFSVGIAIAIAANKRTLDPGD
ncbi:hypothetical protein AB0O95_11235 [Rhodoglobus sp. NPDC076762]